MPYKDKETARLNREKNKEKCSVRRKERYKLLPEEKKQQAIKAWNAWTNEHPEYRLWNQAKQSAKQRGLAFSIEKEDIFIPEFCPYLGVRLTNIKGGGRSGTNISLDRIDNTKGYIKGNVQVISSKANYMKRDASIQELLDFARGILEMHGK